MTTQLFSRLAFATSILGALSVSGQYAAGGEIVDYGPDTCTAINCNAATFNGIYTVTRPYVTQIYSAGGECVRIDVTASVVDLEAVLVAPNGLIWRNDDRQAGKVDLKPLIKAITPTGQRGLYTLILSHFDGAGSSANFTLAYGRYVAANPNCLAPTPATLPAAVAAAKSAKR